MAEKSKTKVDKLTEVFNKLCAPDKTEIDSTADHESRDSEGEVSIFTEESDENSRVEEWYSTPQSFSYCF